MRFGMLFLVLAFSVVIASADELSLGNAPLDIALAEELALENDLTLQSRRVALEVARVRMEASGKLEDPELRLGYGENHSPAEDALTSDKDSQDVDLALRFFPPNPWTRSFGKESARAVVRAEEAGLRLARQDLLLTVRRLYARIRYMRQDLALLQTFADVRKDVRQATQEMYQQGEATSIMAVNTGLDYLKSITARDEARRELAQTTSELEAIIGVSALQQVTLTPLADTDEQAIMKQTLLKLQEKALEARPDLAVLTWRLGASESDMQVQDRQRRPWFSHVQFSVQDEQGDEADESWKIQAAINLPVFSYVTAGEDDVQEAEVHRLRAELLEARARVQREVSVAWEAWKSARESTKEYARNIQPLVEEMEALMPAGELESDLGVDLQMRVHEGLITAQRARLLSEYSLQKAVFDLDQATGLDLSHLP